VDVPAGEQATTPTSFEIDLTRGGLNFGNIDFGIAMTI
jgi:hypothetical protein